MKKNNTIFRGYYIGSYKYKQDFNLKQKVIVRSMYTYIFIMFYGIFIDSRMMIKKH